MLPFRDGTAADFAAVRDLLRAVGYTAANIENRIGIENIHQFRPMGEGRTESVGLDDSLDLLIRLFMDGVAVRISEVDRLLPDDGACPLLTLGLLDRHPVHAEAYAASVRLYPIDDVYIVSDLESRTPGLRTPDELEPPDHVFSALTTLTGTFLEQLPIRPCSRFLELCAGSGVAALLASRFCDHAWATDITERSTAFARFNAALNGVTNVTAAQGDLFEAVAGRQFDRIVAHPPYVPAPENTMIYRDGGEDGEWIIRRILADLPDYLAVGGRFYLTCAASDRKNAPLEQRIRSMIGDRQSEFDLLLVTHYVLSPHEYYGRLAASNRIDYTVAQARIAQFKELEAEAIVYCSAVLQRNDGSRPPFTLRRERNEGSAGAETDWLMNWATRMATEDVLPVLLDSRPRLLATPRLEVVHRVEDGEWKVDISRVRTEYPFIRTVDLSLNAAMLLTLCDGEHTGREILDRVRGGGAIPSEVPESSFAEFLRELVTEGVLGLGDEPTPVLRKANGASGVAPLPTP